MRVIVCGGRDYFDQDRVFAALDRVHAKSPITMLVHGGACGADQLSGRWADERGVSFEVFKADWEHLRKSAGPIRNQRMADAGADGCVAFPGGRGTADMIQRARAAGIPVWEPYHAEQVTRETAPKGDATVERTPIASNGSSE